MRTLTKIICPFWQKYYHFENIWRKKPTNFPMIFVSAEWRETRKDYSYRLRWRRRNSSTLGKIMGKFCIYPKIFPFCSQMGKNWLILRKKKGKMFPWFSPVHKLTPINLTDNLVHSSVSIICSVPLNPEGLEDLVIDSPLTLVEVPHTHAKIHLFISGPTPPHIQKYTPYN